MRIIGGKLKRKNISFLKVSTTRPLKDSVKENIFNVLAHSNLLNISLNKSFVLDLYSGIGSFGIECLSRGVKKVFFVENYSNVLILLKKNLSSLKSIQNYTIIEKDIYNEDMFSNLDCNFDIIFLDPPYKDKNLENLLNEINNQNILDKNGIIILHRHKNETDSLPQNFQIIEQKVYGISKIIFLSYLN